MWKFVVVLTFIMTSTVLHAATYTADKRVYVQDWCADPYNKIVAFFPPDPGRGTYWASPSCTAEYVDRDLILTALHCLDDDADTFQISNCKNPNRRYNVKVVSKGSGTEVADWALLRILDEAGFSDDYFTMSSTTPETTKIINAGWGNVRPLSDEEIMQIKDIVREEVKKPGVNLYTLREKVEQQINLDEPASTPYEKLLKANTQCEITGSHNKEACALDQIRSDNVAELCNRNNTDPKWQEFCQNHEKYGADFQRICEKSKNFFNATCNTQSGNSGGPYFLNNTIYGLVSRGGIDIAKDKNTIKGKDTGLKTDSFYQAFLAARFKPATQQTQNTQNTRSGQPAQNPAVPASVANEQTITPAAVQALVTQSPTPSSTPSNTVNITSDMTPIATPPVVSVPKEAVHVKEEAVRDRINNIDNASLSEVLDLVHDIVDLDELQKAYDRAKEREQSTANKILGAAAIAATGQGLKALFSGAAEQAADAATEKSMKAYLETFRCSFGGGSYRGGETNIELPNAADLGTMKSEYMTRAAELKATKEALGMKPGIESEVVMDAATMGLHDDERHGIEKGAFTSISRALLDKEGEDAAAFDKQKSAASKKKTTGGVVAGVGAVGGMVGNAIINKDKDDDRSDTKDKK